jgi:hypothetical protein
MAWPRRSGVGANLPHFSLLGLLLAVHRPLRLAPPEGVSPTGSAPLGPYSPTFVEGEFCEVRSKFVIVQPEKLHDAYPAYMLHIRQTQLLERG